MAIRSALIVVLAAASVCPLTGSQQSEEDVAANIVIGQAYRTGNIIVGGFIEDRERRWPQRLSLVPITPAGAQIRNAAFANPLPFDRIDETPELQPEVNIDIDSVFSTQDRASDTDVPLAVYKSASPLAQSTSIIGWSNTLALSSVSIKDRGRARPVSAGEREEIAHEKQALPKDVECTTEPQWLDSAKIIVTAAISGSAMTIRVSQYQTPGCLGHLSMIYVLDVMTPGREPKRFEFRHYQGIL
jgi:hypothetical protein